MATTDYFTIVVGGDMEREFIWPTRRSDGYMVPISEHVMALLLCTAIKILKQS